MQQERTWVSFDWAIKYLLRNKADYVILEGFLTTLLGKKIKIQNLTESESNKASEALKINKVDVLAEEEDGTLIIIEVQFTEELDYFHRMLFGSSKAIVEHIGKGIKYSKVKKVYSVNVVYFDLGSGRDYIYHGTTTFRGLHYKDELELTEEQKAEFAKLEIKDIYPEYYLLKVDRFKNVIKNKIDEWMYFLKNSKIKPKFKAPGLAEAIEKLEYSRLSPKERRAYDEYLDIQRSNESGLYTAKLKGKIEGEAIGEARGLEKGEAIGEARGIKKGKAEGKAEGIAEGEARVLTLVAKGHSLEQIKKILKGKK
jgi:predicted transposase/invertase (TIGR01784 family)